MAEPEDPLDALTPERRDSDDCRPAETCRLDPARAEAAMVDPVAHARQVLAEHQAAQAAACQAEIQAVLDKYGMRLEISTPQIAIVPAQ